MTWITVLVVLAASRCDSLRDRHFDPERRTRWRLPIAFLPGQPDPWHLVKWAAFYPPLVLVCWHGYGPPWASWAAFCLWAGTAVGSWIVWRWGSPWPSQWGRWL